MLRIFARILLVAVTFCLPGIVLNSLAEEEPYISRAGNAHVLNLPKSYKEAIKTYNPAFQIRKEADYLPALIKDYLFTNLQVPYAVLGDFNGDGKRDAVLQGFDKNNELIIAVLSAQGGPVVMEVSKSKLVDPKTELYDFGDHSENGVWIYLTFVFRGNVDSPFAKRPLQLSTDAFQLNYFRKASVLYYLVGQRFQKSVIDDETR